MEPRLLTAEEFMQQDDLEAPVELVRGVVSDLPFPSPRHGQVCCTIGCAIGAYVDQGRLGHIMSNHTCIVTERNPDTVRCCDICYVSQTRIPSIKERDGFFLPAQPDLIVEVRADYDRWIDMLEKAVEYLNSGVTVVCVLDPTTETSRIYRSDRDEEQLKNGDLVRFEDVLPGFSVPLKQLFE